MDRRNNSLKAKITASTPYGPIGIVWAAKGGHPLITRVLLSKPRFSAEAQLLKHFGKLPVSSCAEIDAVASKMRAFLEGENVCFDLALANMDQCSMFQRSVLRAEHRIPWGSVSTFRLIAARLGKPNGARAVGNALAGNPFPIIVPCHRAIRSDGDPGGYQGGPAMKRALLKKEGMFFDDAGRVVSPRIHYRR